MDKYKILDLRFVIGAFFTIIGAVLWINTFFGHPVYNLNQAIGWGMGFDQSNAINRWCGTTFIIFGISMVILSFVKDADDELLNEHPSDEQ